MSFTALHRVAERTMQVDAPPSAVFPLLCPVREREWIPGWDAEVLHSTSGVAELGCVFVAKPGGKPGPVFVITRHDRDRAVEFALFHGHTAERLCITLTPSHGGTTLVWTRTYTALSPEGNAWIEANVPAVAEARLAMLEEELRRFLAKSG